MLRSAMRYLAPLLLLAASGQTVRADKGAEASPLSIEDVYRLDSAQNIALAPDETYVVYARQWVDPASKRERFSLWRNDLGADAPRALETGEPDARAPVISPDGRWIAVRSTRDRPDGYGPLPATPAASEPAVDIWLLPAAGGQAIPLAGPDKPYGRVLHDPFYGRVAFDKDSRRVVFVADDGRDQRSPDEIAADVYVERPDQGEGYTGYGAAQVWVATLAEQPGRWAAQSITRLTDDDVWYGDPQWSADGQWLVVHANRTLDRESARFSINKNFDLWAIQLSDRSLHQLTAGEGPDISPRFSPDGSRIAFLSSPRRGPHTDIFNLSLVAFPPQSATPAPTEFVFNHHERAEYVVSDPPPIYPLADDCWEGPGQIAYTAAQGAQTAIMLVDLKDNSRTQLVLPSEAPPATEGGYRRRSVLRRQLAPPADPFLQMRLMGRTSVVTWQNDAGQTIEGVLTLPNEQIAQPPYKLVLFPHGGPHSRSTTAFNFTAEIFAAHGYGVFQPNFRGSAGYGRAFLDADRGDFGGGDMRDITSGIDYLAREKLIDPRRQFVYGVSYGGYMTCWLVGHTRQFRAAVAQNAVTDLNVMWGLSDLQSWTQWEFGGLPWQAADAMRAHSPLIYAADVSTPTLVLHSRDDRRCPLPMGRMFYQALLATGTPTQLVVYPDEGHGIRQPRHKEDVLRRTLAWFSEHGGER